MMADPAGIATQTVQCMAGLALVLAAASMAGFEIARDEALKGFCLGAFCLFLLGGAGLFVYHACRGACLGAGRRGAADRAPQNGRGLR